MRVITGTARGRRLETPRGLETRPTTELVKEAVFSMIQFEVEGARVLDLFAGSGQMGIEALSRGAHSCVFVDTARESQTVMKKNLATVGFSERAKLSQLEVGAYLQTAKGPFDIVFLDPPYNQGILQRILPLVAEQMSESGVVLCESESTEALPAQVGDLTLKKSHRYGRVKISVYRMPPQDGENQEL